MDTETLEQKGMTTFEGTLKRAKEGNALSQNLLGLWILHGDLPERVEVDEAPFELIRMSAEQGFAAAQYNMGVLQSGKSRMQGSDDIGGVVSLQRNMRRT